MATKLIYKKRNILNLFKQNNANEKKLFDLFLPLFNKDNECYNYPIYYNTLIKENDTNKIISFLEELEAYFQNILKSKQNEIEQLKSNEDKIQLLFSTILNIEKQINITRDCILSNKLKFSQQVINEFNKRLGINNLISNFEKNNVQLYTNINEYFLNLKDNIKFIKFLKIFKICCSSNLYNNLISKLIDNTYKKFEEYVSTFKVDTVNGLLSYFTDIKKKIDEEVTFITLFSNNFQGNISNQKLTEIACKPISNINANILKNNDIIEQFINEDNYKTFNYIFELMKENDNFISNFCENIFNCIYDNFENKNILKEGHTLREGINYIENLVDTLRRLKEMNNKYFKKIKNIFNNYQNLILKLTNRKNIKSFSFLLSCYINEKIIVDKQKIFNKEISKIIKNINSKEKFFYTSFNFILKRICTFKFQYEREEELIKFLIQFPENTFKIRYINLINYIKENKNLSNTSTNVFLLTNNVIKKDYLMPIINIGKDLNEFKSTFESYMLQYPRRVITISQIYTTSLLSFNNKIDLIVNYIQTKILLLFNKIKEHKLSYKQAILLNEVDDSMLKYFKGCFLSLIQNKIIILEGSNSSAKPKLDFRENDVFVPNFYLTESYKNNVPINCFERAFGNFERELMKKTNDNKNENGDDYTKNYFERNKKFIIMCKAMKEVKKVNPKTIPKNELIQNILTAPDLQVYFENKNQDYILIKNIIEGLVEKNFITSSFIEGKNYYGFNK